MKTLITNDLGGMPFEGDDLTWLTEGNLEAFERLMNAFLLSGDTHFIISGCEAVASGADVVVSPGYLFISNKIVAYTGETKSPSFGTPEFDTDFTYDPDGNETFEDEVVRDTYRIDYAILASAGGTLTQAEYIEAVNTYARMSDGWKLNSVVEDWKLLSVLAPYGTPAASFSPGGNTPFQYRLMEGNRVELSGSFYHPFGSVGNLGTLPIGYRPDKRVYLPLLMDGGSGSPRQNSLRIDTSGVMRLGDSPFSLGSTAQYSLDGLSFPLTRGI